LKQRDWYSLVSYWCLTSGYILQVLRTDYFYRDECSVGFLLAFHWYPLCRKCYFIWNGI